MNVLFRAWIAALLGALVLLTPGSAGVASAASGPYPPPTAEGSGSVTPSRACAGHCVLFSGTGFAPGTEVVIRDDGRVVGTARADADGKFKTKVCFGTSAKVGKHSLTGSGTGADGRPLVVSADVYVCGVSQRPGTGPGDGNGGANGGGNGGANGGGNGGAAGGGIPFTGFAGALLALVGIVLVALGSAMLLALERRHRIRRRAHRRVPTRPSHA